MWLRKILPCLCPWKTDLHARLQNSLSQYVQLCRESCTQQAGWVVPEDDNQSGKYDLLIRDDFGLQPMDDKTRLAMLQIIEERYERKSVIIASQLPITKWYDYIGDPTLADAIMDRLVANASKIELKGDSMRQKLKK